MPDPIFADPRLAELYDVVDDDRRDLDLYTSVAAELGATSVLDVGCGTGTLACRLALDGTEVVGVDPATASLDVARRKPGADRVRWIEGDASAVSPAEFDLAVMTGNVAQVFLTDDEWTEALTAMHSALRARGWLVFETRDLARRAWERWTRDQTYRAVQHPHAGRVETWTELLDANAPVVSFRHRFRFELDGTELASDSTLRFRDRDEVVDDLGRCGFSLREVRDAPDRPGLEFVFLAQRER